MPRTKPRHCDRCNRHFPTTGLYKSHIYMGCCNGRTRGTHIACSSCSASMAGLSVVADAFLRDEQREDR